MWFDIDIGSKRESWLSQWQIKMRTLDFTLGAVPERRIDVFYFDIGI